ncbi:hypothetical protein AXW82_02190 [Mycoplasmopsis canis PG 14]|nr:hypothetical protein [Mycoplasmopsis canis]AMD81349.1 hypothetical protein AXW82_02190 [Mycoplasmopsis canis PG 14]
MKLKYLFMMGLVPSILGISAISANKNENNQEYTEKKEFILHSEIMRIKRLTNKDTKYLWSKEITDIFNRKFF